MAYIRKQANGKFRVEIKHANKFIQNKTFISESAAQEWAFEVEQNIEKILNLKPKKLSKLTPEKIEALGGVELLKKLGITLNIITFRKLADEYMHQWDGKDSNQAKRVGYWVDVFADTPLKSIKVEDVKDAINQYKNGKCCKGGGIGKVIQTDKPRAPATVQRQKAVLSSLFKYAVDQGYVKSNPVMETPTIKIGNNQIERFLSDEERTRLLQACKKSKWPKLYLLVLMSLTCGARRSELLNLRWSEINFKDGTARLADTKNGSSRVLTFPQITMDEMISFREVGNGLIFPSPSNPEKPFSFRKHWEKALQDANIHNFRWHDLRHDFCTQLAVNGIEDLTIAKLAGHKSLQTTARYTHMNVKRAADVTEKVMGALYK